ncbi:MAG: hypothetical protein ACSW8F_02390, partial [bacterium]
MAWLLLTLGAILFYLFDNHAGTRGFLLAAVLLPALSLLLLLLRRKGEISLSAPAEVEKGSTVFCTLT